MIVADPKAGKTYYPTVTTIFMQIYGSISVCLSVRAHASTLLEQRVVWSVRRAEVNAALPGFELITFRFQAKRLTASWVI